MKINANNSNISPSDKSIKRDEINKTGNPEKENNGVKYKDRVELSGDSTNRTNLIDKKNNPYSDHVNNDEAKVSKNINHISRNEKLSPERLTEIKDRIAKGFYDTDEVIDGVAKLIFQDVKKVDKNI